jgi:hypothetical protein
LIRSRLFCSIPLARACCSAHSSGLLAVIEAHFVLVAS